MQATYMTCKLVQVIYSLVICSRAQLNKQMQRLRAKMKVGQVSTPKKVADAEIQGLNLTPRLESNQL